MLFKGIAGSNGIEIAPAYIYQPDPAPPAAPALAGDAASEISALKQALLTARGQVELIRDKALQTAGAAAAIFDAHLLLLDDPQYLAEIVAAIGEEKLSAVAAVDRVTASYAALFAAMEDEYMRERGADIKDIGERVRRCLLGLPPQGLAHLDSPVIVIAPDLSPSDTMTIDARYVKGFVTNSGGRTSHAAIIARTLEIPAVLGLGDITARLKSGDCVVIDGSAGTVIVDPDPEQQLFYRRKRQRFLDRQAALQQLAGLPAVTVDGHRLEVSANIGAPRDIDAALAYGADGVGLFRTEFLYLEKNALPGEEEQFQTYKAAAEKLGRRPLIIRTLDIGGDKELPGLQLPAESNPFLGYRAIRICLDRRDLFKTQLRAILRAGAYGNLLLMYPMISGVAEVRAANAVLAEVKQELRQQGLAFDELIKVGVMIEVPSAAVTADSIIREVDFFSIGTNDLCQYTLAVDRLNEKVAGLYQPLHPAVLRLIKTAVDASHAHGKFTGMCGELAGEALAAPLLLGLGLDELSMNAASMPWVKQVIQRLSLAEASQTAAAALELETPEAVKAYLTDVLARLGLTQTEEDA
ncbi:MAG: phosphoenolpyruvate--protein phosphotransferase [Sporomusaceae bacterium]|nr:phosphoenolpyruvate--protein phosphotransferase [Sporomusaceae bacterium]